MNHAAPTRINRGLLVCFVAPIFYMLNHSSQESDPPGLPLIHSWQSLPLSWNVASVLIDFIMDYDELKSDNFHPINLMLNSMLYFFNSTCNNRIGNMNDVEVNNLVLVGIVQQVAEGRDNDATLTLTPIPAGPNAAVIRPMLLQNQPGYAPKPAGVNVATYEIILRMKEMEKLLASHDRAYQQQSLLKLRQSFLALPAKLSVEYDPSDSGVLSAFEKLSEVIFRLDEVLRALAEGGMTPEYAQRRTDEITQKFLEALQKCVVAVGKARKIYKDRFVGGIATGVAGTVVAVAAAPITAPVAVTSAVIAIGGFIFATVSGKAKSQTEEIDIEVQAAERAQSRRK